MAKPDGKVVEVVSKLRCKYGKRMRKRIYNAFIEALCSKQSNSRGYSYLSRCGGGCQTRMSTVVFADGRHASMDFVVQF